MPVQDEYLETKVLTAPPHQLHLMVIDGAIRFATEAENALAEKDYETTHFALSKSRDFVTELISGIKEDEAPEMAENLKNLFLFIYRNLVEADREHDPQKIHDALQIMRMHRDTWLELTKMLADEQTATAATAASMSAVPASKSWSR